MIFFFFFNVPQQKQKCMNSINIPCFYVAGLKLKTGSGVVVYDSNWANKHLRLNIYNGAEGIIQYITITNDMNLKPT